MPPNKKTSINETKPTDIMARKTVRASIADSMPQGNSFRTELVPVTTAANGPARDKDGRVTGCPCT